mmetsp:Transcript_7270/g.11605  ORF Transcript_7270/g.11605 Transcript_7270/m.11605 type:complete len:396 (+) Transcript_7270:48-1235(+)
MGKREKVNRRLVVGLAICALMTVILVHHTEDSAVSNTSQSVVYHKQKVALGVIMAHVELAKKSKNVSQFVSMLHPGKSDSPVALTYASFKYRLTLLNWLVALNRVNFQKYVIVCLDVELDIYLAHRGVACYPLWKYGSTGKFEKSDNGKDKNSVKQINQLWVTRMSHLVELLNSGQSVILSDSDAVWLDNPISTGLLTPNTGDIVLSRGKFPFDIAKKWGATGCMGVAYFRASKKVVALMQKVYKVAQKTGDDQVAVNRVLFETYGKDPFALFGHKLSVFSTNLDHTLDNPKRGDLPKVVILAHSVVPRFCKHITPLQWETQVQIAHCHPKDGIVEKTFVNWGVASIRQDVMARYDIWCPNVTTASQDNPIEFFKWLDHLALQCAFMKVRQQPVH